MRLSYMIAGAAAALLAGASLASAQEVIVQPWFPGPAYAYPNSYGYIYPNSRAYAYSDTYSVPRTVYGVPNTPPVYPEGVGTPDDMNNVVRPSDAWRSRSGDSAN